jgi:hypothetical protein
MTSILWVITPCGLLKASRSFDSWLPHGGILLGLLFNPDDGVNMFFRNVDGLSKDYNGLHPPKQITS